PSSHADCNQWQLCGEQHRQAHPAAQLPPGHARVDLRPGQPGRPDQHGHLVPHPAASVLAQHPPQDDAGRVIGLGNCQLHGGAEQQLLRVQADWHAAVRLHIGCVHAGAGAGAAGSVLLLCTADSLQADRDGRLRCRVFLNSQRQTTYGLSKVMVAMGAVGKTTDYLGPYLLCMPLQYAVLAFFSSTVSQISSLQVLWYWNRVPASVAAQSVDGGGAAAVGDDDDGRVVQLPMTPGCQAARWLGISALVTELGAFAGAFVWRTGSWWALAAPLCTFAVCVAAWCAYHLRKVAAPAAAKAAADQLEPPPGPKLLDSAEQTKVDMK
ncbi:hypothetical protein BOX15_Mlig001271g1, partial [Macrostomum lignano]